MNFAALMTFMRDPNASWMIIRCHFDVIFYETFLFDLPQKQMRPRVNDQKAFPVARLKLVKETMNEKKKTFEGRLTLTSW